MWTEDRLNNKESSCSCRSIPPPKLQVTNKPKTTVKGSVTPEKQQAAKKPATVSPKNRFLSSHHTGAVKQTDYTNETNAIKLKGSVAIINVVKKNGEPAYKAGLKGANLSNTIDTTELMSCGSTTMRTSQLLTQRASQWARKSCWAKFLCHGTTKAKRKISI